MTALTFALRHWQAIIGGVLAIGLSIALYVTRSTLETRTEKLSQATEWQANVRSVTSHAADIRDKNGKPALLALDQVPVQIAYLGNDIVTLQGVVASKNAETEARGKALVDSKADNAKSVATADARQSADKGRRDTLLALAKELPANPACKAPAALLAQIEGL